jgi:hypothetical protein
MAGTFEDLLDRFHQSDTVLALEAASPEDVGNVVGNLRKVHGKIEELVKLIRSIDKKLGYWRRLYQPRIQKLERLRTRLSAEIDALSPTGSPLILLTKNDQHHLVDSLLQPSEPNDALRRAFARK